MVTVESSSDEGESNDDEIPEDKSLPEECICGQCK
jgi:hypothetical protein